MTLVNGLWFHEFEQPTTTLATINKTNDACLSNLWHGRLAHAGQNCMRKIHKHVIGIDKPIKHNPLYKCGSCLPAKMSKTPHKRTTKYKNKRQNNTTTKIEKTDSPALDDPCNNDDEEVPTGVAGQHFHMDFGFVWGSEYSIKHLDFSNIVKSTADSNRSDITRKN